VSVVPFVTPGVGDPTTQKYLGLAQAELQAVTTQANNISSEISGLQSQLSALQETQAELNRLITDLQNP
jgi:prefoldin subunit 5